MTLHSDTSDPHRGELNNDATWIKLYSFLRLYVKRLVYSSGISSWRGQEEDIVEDIIQETVIRILKYARRADCGEANPVGSLEGLAIIIARNYFEDLRRHDRRIVHLADGRSSRIDALVDNHVDPSELALNNVFLEWLYMRFSLEIVKFSQKQRIALLIDLASHMDFDVRPTPLQQALLEVGIQLQNYRQAPQNPIERSRYSSNLSLAYKRIKQLGSDPQFDPVA